MDQTKEKILFWTNQAGGTTTLGKLQRHLISLTSEKRRKLIDELVEEGYLLTHPQLRTGPGRSALAIALTETGRDHLRTLERQGALLKVGKNVSIF